MKLEDNDFSKAIINKLKELRKAVFHSEQGLLGMKGWKAGSRERRKWEQEC